jgi:geranylgeranyl reductase family protein
MENLYDVIIVGAGPASGSAAFFLRQAGRRVLVLEKASLPRYKPCGGALSAGLLSQFPFSFDAAIEARIEKVTYALGKRSIAVPLPKGSICMVMRDDFDYFLLKQSQAEVRQGAAVHSVTELPERVAVTTKDGQVFEGRYVIGADGANSVVARQVGLRRGKSMVAALEAEVKVPPEIFRRFENAPLFIFGEMRYGYLWVFPKAEHLSVGIAGLRPERGQLQETLSRVMGHYGISIQGARIHGHPIPIYMRREPIATARTLLVGDAAGLVDPLTGEGIRFAIKSGRLAAQAILSGRPERYSGLVRREIGFSHTLAYLLAAVFYRFPRTCFLLGVRNPFATTAFLDLLSERGGYAQLYLRLFGSLPLYLLVEALAGLAGLAAGPRSRQRIRAAVYR